MRQIKYYLTQTGILLDYSNNLFLLVMPIVLLFLSFSSFYYIALLIPFLLYFLLTHKKKLFFTLIILILFVAIHYFIQTNVYDVNRYSGLVKEDNGIVIEKKEYESSYSDAYFRYTIKIKKTWHHITIKRFKIYAFDSASYEIGDYVYLKGTINEIDGEKIENAFDYESFLNHSKIYYSMSVDESKKVSKGFTIYFLKEKVYAYFNKHFEGTTLILLKGLVLGDSSGFSDELDDALKENGILHLFAVSGLHISLFVSLLSLLLSLTPLKEKWIENVICIFLTLYLIITSFSVSILRASLMYFFGLINKRLFNKIFSSLDVVSFTFLLLIIINPYYAYNTGFILSFMVSFIIVLVSSLLSNYSSAAQILIISMISNIATIPIIININYEYNLLTPFLNVLYISLVSDFILPFGFLVLVLPILSYSYDIVIRLFLKLIDFTSNIHLTIYLPHFNALRIIVFYLLLLLIIYSFSKKKKRAIVSFVFILFLFYLGFFSSYKMNPTIDFLYLNDGDTSIIHYLNQVVVVDTGDGTNNEVLSFLKSKGIRKIDYLIITHEHDDHYGGASEIINQLKVKHVVTSNYYDYPYTYQQKVKEGDIINLKGIKMVFLCPINESSEENSNSLIFLLYIKSKTILFTGDATIEEEIDLITELKKRNINHIDILKVAHHGSAYGTGEALTNYLKMDYAVIMVGKKRILTHPSKEVVNRLKNKGTKLFITTTCYSVSIKIKNDSLTFNTLKET